MVWGMFCACYDDVILDGALSSNPRTLICRVANKFENVVGMIHNLWASKTSSPLPLCIWVVLYHWWLHLPSCCQFVEALVVVCVLFLWVWFWWHHFVRRCTVLIILLLWPMTWHFWLCVWCWVRLHCLVVRLCRWRERSVNQLCCVLWVHGSLK